MCQPTNAFDSTWVCRLGLLPRVIDREAELPALCEAITAAPWVALDTEADSLHAYPEKLCLIQISVPGRDELVDPLAGMDMCDFFSALNRHTLLMHGADYDVRLFKRGCDFVPNQIFDTMLAARLTGRMQFGLSALVNEFLGVELEKGSRKANWARRPLTPKMAEYAVNDTLHLRPLVDALQGELREKGREDWHRQECARLVADNSVIPEPDPDLVWRIKGSAKLAPRALSVLRELWHWREEEARRRNRPPFFILSPEAMILLADTAAQKQSVSHLMPKRMPDHRKSIIRQRIKTGMEIVEADCPARHKSPPRKHITPAQKRRLTEIQAKRDRQADGLKIDPTLIASRTTMVRLACEAEGVLEDVLPWQRELLEVS